jgi:CBS domain-containing protein
MDPAAADRDERKRMLIRELVAGEVDACSPEVPVAEAARTMAEHGVGSLAVIDKGDLVGILTERDVLRLVGEGGDASTTPVRSVMTPDPDSLGPEIETTEAAEWMMAAGYRHMPVLEDGNLIGMVSIKDLLWAVLQSEAD